MKPLKEALINKDKRDWASANKRNKYGITEKDLVGELAGFPLGVVVKMMEEQEKQKNTPDIIVFQRCRIRDAAFGGFHWEDTEDGEIFWENVITKREFNIFFNKYPDYKKYN